LVVHSHRFISWYHVFEMANGHAHFVTADFVERRVPQFSAPQSRSLTRSAQSSERFGQHW
jgi:hypothetical protein